MDERYRDIHSIMVENAECFGDKTYIVSVDQGKRITFSQFNHYCNKVANFLKDKDVKKDDRVSLIGKNSIETLIIFFGVQKYGAIISPVNFEESEENVRHMIERVRPRFVIHDEELTFDYTNTPYARIPFSELDTEKQKEDDFFTVIQDYDSVFQAPVGEKDDIAEIVFTSGTTEIPKGVIYSREGLFYMVNEVIDMLWITDADRILEYRAYSWASPQLLTILSSMVTGATLILARKFSRSRFALWLKENDVTISSGVPTVINMLVNDPVKLHKNEVPALKFITSSSAPLSAEMHHRFERIYGIPINQMGGQTEAGWMFANPPEKRKNGSVGTAFKYKEIYIVDKDSRKCKPGEEGELVIKGKSVGVGYLNDYGEIDRFPEGGIPTGDLGYKDSDGYVFLTGRKKDIIIRGGVNISPLQITDRLMQHPQVKEAVTIGVPDKIYGEEIASFIVPISGRELEKQNILDHCKEKLPDFKLPKIIRFITEIPKTKNEKVAKQALLKLILEDKLGPSETP
jgi:acyl-coenzyme A synthetase/AMP-(fatty) acid ligase